MGYKFWKNFSFYFLEMGWVRGLDFTRVNSFGEFFGSL